MWQLFLCRIMLWHGVLLARAIRGAAAPQRRHEGYVAEAVLMALSSGATLERRQLKSGLQPLTTLVCSPQSNGIDESFVKSI